MKCADEHDVFHQGDVGKTAGIVVALSRDDQPLIAIRQREQLAAQIGQLFHDTKRNSGSMDS